MIIDRDTNSYEFWSKNQLQEIQVKKENCSAIRDYSGGKRGVCNYMHTWMCLCVILLFPKLTGKKTKN